jgi:hypothetical protein
VLFKSSVLKSAAACELGAFVITALAIITTSLLKEVITIDGVV